VRRARLRPSRNAEQCSWRQREFPLGNPLLPVGLLLLAGRVAPTRPRDTLWEEVALLGRGFTASATPAGPTLFLHVLDRFRHTARVPFPANALRQTLFSAKSAALSRCSDNTMPLAAFDPVEVVNALLDVLEQVATTCAQLAAAFTSFRLAGPSILQGRQDHGDCSRPGVQDAKWAYDFVTECRSACSGTAG